MRYRKSFLKSKAGRDMAEKKRSTIKEAKKD